MRGDEVIESRLSSRDDLRRSSCRLGCETLDGLQVIKSLLLAQGAPMNILAQLDRRPWRGCIPLLADLDVAWRASAPSLLQLSAVEKLLRLRIGRLSESGQFLDAFSSGNGSCVRLRQRVGQNNRSRL